MTATIDEEPVDIVNRFIEEHKVSKNMHGQLKQIVVAKITDIKKGDIWKSLQEAIRTKMMPFLMMPFPMIATMIWQM